MEHVIHSPRRHDCKSSHAGTAGKFLERCHSLPSTIGGVVLLWNSEKTLITGPLLGQGVPSFGGIEISFRQDFCYAVRRMGRIFVTVLLLVMAAGAADPDLTGTWNVTVNTTPKQTVTAVWVLRQDDMRLSGTYRAAEVEGTLVGTATHSRAIIRYTQNGTEYLLTGDILSPGRIEGSVRIKGDPKGFFHASRAQ